MNLIIEKDGQVRGIYGEVIDLATLGTPAITRASHVEPDDQGRWLADLSPVGGPVLGPFASRSEALEAEVAWLEAYWIENVKIESAGRGSIRACQTHRDRSPRTPRLDA